jgi:hypothetical protein
MFYLSNRGCKNAIPRRDGRALNISQRNLYDQTLTRANVLVRRRLLQSSDEDSPKMLRIDTRGKLS